MSSKRNQTCPCGSGRKYKRCCGARGTQEQRVTAEDRLKAIHELSVDIQRPALESHLERCHEAFYGAWSHLPRAQLAALTDRVETRLAWLMFVALDEVREPTGKRVIDELLDRRGPSLPIRVRRALQDLAAARLRAYEIVGACSEHGELTLSPLGDGPTTVVRDAQLAGRPGAAGGLLVARLVAGEEVGTSEIAADLYVFEAKSRPPALEILGEAAQLDLDARLVHDLWLLENGHAGGEYLRAHSADDLTALMAGGDLSFEYPRRKRNRTIYLGRIAAVASTDSRQGRWVESFLRCRRRPDHRDCLGLIQTQLSPKGYVQWRCPACGDSGHIGGWRGTPFDLSDRAEVVTSDEPELEGMQVLVLSFHDLNRLWRLSHLTAPALRALASSHWLTSGRQRVVGRPEELRELARCITVHFTKAQHLSRVAMDDLYQLHGGIALFAEGRPDLSSAAQAGEILLYHRSKRHGPRPAPTAAPGTHRLRVELVDLDPPIWRQLEVPSDFTLEDLADALILAFGWENKHLHLFEHDGRSYAPPGFEAEQDHADERATTLATLVPQAGDQLLFAYDLGDDWRHGILVEEVLSTPIPHPRLLAGERAAPPEDCGGPPGFEQLLDILANPFHEEYGEVLEWCDGFEPAEFDLETFADRLRRMTARRSTPAPSTQET